MHHLSTIDTPVCIDTRIIYDMNVGVSVLARMACFWWGCIEERTLFISSHRRQVKDCRNGPHPACRGRPQGSTKVVYGRGGACPHRRYLTVEELAAPPNRSTLPSPLRTIERFFIKLMPMGLVPALGVPRSYHATDRPQEIVYGRGDPCAAKHRRRRLPCKLLVCSSPDHYTQISEVLSPPG